MRVGYRNNRKISLKKGANFTPSLDIHKFLWYNYTIADSMFTAIFNHLIIIEDPNLQTLFHTLLWRGQESPRRFRQCEKFSVNSIFL